MTIISVGEPLRHYCNGEQILRGEGSTVQEVLADACKPYPRLQAKLFNPDRHLSARVLVYANHTDIRLLQHEQTPVDADTEMKLVVALCGG